jgi:hypothetical protein
LEKGRRQVKDKCRGRVRGGHVRKQEGCKQGNDEMTSKGKKRKGNIAEWQREQKEPVGRR